MLFMGFEGMEERKFHKKVQIKLILILAYEFIK